MAMNLSKEFLFRIRGMWRCLKSFKMTHLPEMTAFLESMMYRFSASSLTKGRLGFGVVEDEGTMLFPFSNLDLFDIFGEKSDF